MLLNLATDKLFSHFNMQILTTDVIRSHYRDQKFTMLEVYILSIEENAQSHSWVRYL